MIALKIRTTCAENNRDKQSVDSMKNRNSDTQILTKEERMENLARNTSPEVTAYIEGMRMFRESKQADARMRGRKEPDAASLYKTFANQYPREVYGVKGGQPLPPEVAERHARIMAKLENWERRQKGKIPADAGQVNPGEGREYKDFVQHSATKNNSDTQILTKEERMENLARNTSPEATAYSEGMKMFRETRQKGAMMKGRRVPDAAGLDTRFINEYPREVYGVPGGKPLPPEIADMHAKVMAKLEDWERRREGKIPADAGQVDPGEGKEYRDYVQHSATNNNNTVGGYQNNTSDISNSQHNKSKNPVNDRNYIDCETTIVDIAFNSNNCPSNIDAPVRISEQKKTAHNVLEKQHETLVKIGYDSMFDDESRIESFEESKYVQFHCEESTEYTDDVWTLLMSRLSELERSYLEILLLSDRYTFNQRNGIPRYDIEDSINEKSSDTIGDAIIDNGTIIEDYRNNLEHVL